MFLQFQNDPKSKAVVDLKSSQGNFATNAATLKKNPTR